MVGLLVHHNNISEAIFDFEVWRLGVGNRIIHVLFDPRTDAGVPLLYVHATLANADGRMSAADGDAHTPQQDDDPDPGGSDSTDAVEDNRTGDAWPLGYPFRNRNGLGTAHGVSSGFETESTPSNGMGWRCSLAPGSWQGQARERSRLVQPINHPVESVDHLD
jgi:hypothetical protein